MTDSEDIDLTEIVRGALQHVMGNDDAFPPGWGGTSAAVPLTDMQSFANVFNGGASFGPPSNNPGTNNQHPEETSGETAAPGPLLGGDSLAALTSLLPPVSFPSNAEDNQSQDASRSGGNNGLWTDMMKDGIWGDKQSNNNNTAVVGGTNTNTSTNNSTNGNNANNNNSDSNTPNSNNNSVDNGFPLASALIASAPMPQSQPSTPPEQQPPSPHQPQQQSESTTDSIWGNSGDDKSDTTSTLLAGLTNPISPSSPSNLKSPNIGTPTSTNTNNSKTSSSSNNNNNSNNRSGTPTEKNPPPLFGGNLTDDIWSSAGMINGSLGSGGTVGMGSNSGSKTPDSNNSFSLLTGSTSNTPPLQRSAPGTPTGPSTPTNNNNNKVQQPSFQQDENGFPIFAQPTTGGGGSGTASPVVLSRPQTPTGSNSSLGGKPERNGPPPPTVVSFATPATIHNGPAGKLSSVLEAAKCTATLQHHPPTVNNAASVTKLYPEPAISFEVSKSDAKALIAGIQRLCKLS